MHVADSLGVNLAMSLMAEVRAGDGCRAKGTAAEPVELETKPTENVSRERIEKVESHKLSDPCHVVLM